MELVHDHIVHLRAIAFAQRHVGEDLRRAANDGRAGIHRGIAGDHADVFRPEDMAEREELLVGQRLDRHGVVRAPLLADRAEMQRQRDERFSRTGRRVEDDVVAGKQLEDGLLLMVVGLDVGFDQPVEKDAEDLVVGRGIGELGGIKGGRHGGRVTHDGSAARRKSRPQGLTAPAKLPRGVGRRVLSRSRCSR